jgi:CDP-diglyceride synthetase
MIFQFIWIFVVKLPDTNKFKKISLSNPDFIFIDKKPFFGGFKMLNYTPILFMPFLFNLFNNQLTYYVLVCILVALGDTLGSIIKRRFGIASGKFMPLVDHGDYILMTGFVFMYLEYISFDIFIYALMLTYIIHPLACFIGYKMKIKKEPL